MGGYNYSNINSSNFNCFDIYDTAEERVGKIIGYCVIILFSILGNSLVVVVIHLDRRMKTNTNRFIVNMCLSDLFATVCVLPITLMFILTNDEWIIPGVLGQLLCKLVPFIQDVSMGVSIFSMTVIAFDRFLAIVHPYKIHFINTKRSLIMIALTWVISVLIHSHYLVNMKVETIDSYMKCRQSWSRIDQENDRIQKIYYPVAFVLLYVLPLLSIGFFYTCVVIELYCRSNTIEQNEEQRRVRNKENQEVAIMLITVVVLFALSWAPMNTLAFLHLFKWKENPPCYARTFKFLAEFLMHSNAAQNAFIYFTFNKRFKHGLKKLFPSKCELGRVHSPEFTNGTTTMGNRFRTNDKSLKGKEGMLLTTTV